MEARDSFCFPKNTKNPNPSPIGKKFGFCCCGAPPGTRTLGPLIKRNQHATIVNFQNCADRSFLLFYRKFKFCVFCILCTCYPLSHPLSSRSGVQKVFLYRRKHCLHRLCVLSGYKHQSLRKTKRPPAVLVCTVSDLFMYVLAPRPYRFAPFEAITSRYHQPESFTIRCWVG